MVFEGTLHIEPVRPPAQKTTDVYRLGVPKLMKTYYNKRYALNRNSNVKNYMCFYNCLTNFGLIWGPIWGAIGSR